MERNWRDTRLACVLFFSLFCAACGPAETGQPTVLPTAAVVGSGQETPSDPSAPGGLKQEIGGVISPVSSGLQKAVTDTGNVRAAWYNGFNHKETWTGNIQPQNEGALFCLMEDSNTVYYVNLGEDYFLYRLENGISELAVAMPVCALQEVNGTLYFMVNSRIGTNFNTEFGANYDVYSLEQAKNGDIYQYCPETGQVSLVYAAGAEGAFVFYAEEEGVHYLTFNIGDAGRGTICGWYVPFSTGSPEQGVSSVCLFRWGDYWVRKDNGIRLTHREDPEETRMYPVPEEIGGIGPFCIAGSELYFSNRTQVARLNLETGEYELIFTAPTSMQEGNRYIDPTTGEETISYASIRDFTITEDGILWVLGNELYRKDLTTGQCRICYHLGQASLLRLYTDGSEVYGLFFYDSEAEGRIARLYYGEGKSQQEKVSLYAWAPDLNGAEQALWETGVMAIPYSEEEEWGK